MAVTSVIDTPQAHGQQDANGHALFSHGEAGALHVLAHQLYDAGQHNLGRHLLAQRLDGYAGTGSEWAHLQFHLGLFEIHAGAKESAYERFVHRLLPIASTTEDALTDAPALAWHLRLAAAELGPVVWQQLRRTALKRLQRPSEPFVELHNLLALAGAGDQRSLEAWLDRNGNRNRNRNRTNSKPGQLIIRAAEALGSYTRGHFRQAARVIEGIIPSLPLIGGSRAQHVLFEVLAKALWKATSGVGHAN